MLDELRVGKCAFTRSSFRRGQFPPGELFNLIYALIEPRTTNAVARFQRARLARFHEFFHAFLVVLETRARWKRKEKRPFPRTGSAPKALAPSFRLTLDGRVPIRDVESQFQTTFAA